jgi:hypothetical protein
VSGVNDQEMYDQRFMVMVAADPLLRAMAADLRLRAGTVRLRRNNRWAANGRPAPAVTVAHWLTRVLLLPLVAVVTVACAAGRVRLAARRRRERGHG